MRSRNITLTVSAILIAGTLMGCRGNPSEEPPYHLQRNMFTQDKGKPQRENTFFEDGRVMRPLEEGTVSASAPVVKTAYYTGKDEQGRAVDKFPEVTVDEKLLKRGQERFNIYCSPCHDRSGSGNGLVIQRKTSWGLGRCRPTLSSVFSIRPLVTSSRRLPTAKHDEVLRLSGSDCGPLGDRRLRAGSAAQPGTQGRAAHPEQRSQLK